MNSKTRILREIELMALFSLAAVVIYCSVSLVMGVRLLLLAKRTRELPEFVIGLAFLSGGMIGYPFSVASRVLIESGRTGATEFTHVVGQTGMMLSAFFLLLSWQRIFYPTSRSAKIFLTGWFAFLIVTLVMVIRISSPGSFSHLVMPTYWIMLVAQGGCYALLGWSSHRYSRMLTKRLAIGLADPVVANRMGLWALSNLSITLSYTYTIVLGVMLSLGLPNIYQPSIVSAFGLISACFITFAFFPPQAYVARVRGTATVQGA